MQWRGVFRSETQLKSHSHLANLVDISWLLAEEFFQPSERFYDLTIGDRIV